MKRRWLIVLIAGLCLAVVAPSWPADDLALGRDLATRECASCHAFSPGTSVDLELLAQSPGPPLSFAGSKYRREWLEGWLQEPRRIRPAGYLPFRYTVSLPEGDRIAVSLLPSHPRLGAAQARMVAAYLESLTRELNPFPAAVPGGSIQAEVHFSKILPCGGCHQARPGQGGVSGPELFTAAARLRRDWALAYVVDPVSWNKSSMPRVTLRSDQLAAIVEYLFAAGSASPEPPLGESALGGTAGKDAPAHPAADRAERLYLLLCSQCHGIRGNGKGINAPSLFVSPRDHTSFDEMSALSDERIFAAIKRGGTSVGKSALMPSWGAVLEDADIRLLVGYLRRLSGTAAH
jgi:mono/diheme cytochrome c family protein